MRLVRVLIRTMALAGVVLLWLPALALLPAALVDRASDGARRLSLFPSALTFWNPFVWECVWHSLAVASAVTLISTLVGLALGALTGPWRFRGRGTLRVLALSTLAVGPFLGSFGLKRLADHFHLVDRLTEATGLSFVLGVPWETALAWLILVAAGSLYGTALVALDVESALARVERSWVETGRALGASRARAWRDLAWPNVRPFVAASAAGVFSIALFEPGGPIVLGLRRTLAYQVVESAHQPAFLAGGATLTLMAIALAGLARFVLMRWGGPTPSPLGADPPAALVRRASWKRSLLTSLVLLGFACLALSPLAGCVLTIVGKGNAAEATTQAISLIYYHLLDPAFVRILVISLTVGLAAALIDGALVRVLIGRGGRLSERVARRLIAAMDHVPPTAIGFGTLALASLLVGGPGPGSPASRGFAEWLDPRRTPAIPLVMALAAAYLSRVASRSAARTDLARPALIESALAMGASPRQSRRMARGPGSDLRWLIFITALAAGSISPALPLTPASDFRPLAPALVDALDNPPRAAAIGLVVFLVTATGYAFAFGPGWKENETR